MINMEDDVCYPLSRGNLFLGCCSQKFDVCYLFFIPCCGCLIFTLENYFLFNEIFCSVHL